MQNSTDSDSQNEIAPVKTVRLIAMPAEGPTPTPEGRFGERLKYARGQLGLTIDAFGRLTAEYDSNRKGVSATSISRYESGENLPGTLEFRLICDALDVPPQWLLYGDVPNSGATRYEQELLHALRGFVSSIAVDSLMGDLLVKPHLQWVVQGTREQLLEKAKSRKPKEK